MFSEELFDGWLAVPSMGNLFEQEAIVTRVQEGAAVVQKLHTDTSLSIPLQADEQSESPQSSSTPNAVKSTSTARKRKGHTKSRLGCTSCKQRKIKCPEQWPSCAHCVKKGTVCRYPKVFKAAQHDRIVGEMIKRQSPRQSVRLSDTPIYSANDMRLFHHYIITAHPFIPEEMETRWATEVPAYSHKYDYLMHAMLALASSHLSSISTDTQHGVALSHRHRAITGLEEAFTRWPPIAEEAHVMLATSFLLAFQAGYIPDAFLDHIVNLRGCHLLSQLIVDGGLPGVFKVDPKMQSSGLKRRLINFPAMNQPLARGALRALTLLVPLLDEARPLERAIFAQLVGCIRPLLTPSTSPVCSPILVDPSSPLLLNYNSPGLSLERIHPPVIVPSQLASISNPLIHANPALSFESIVEHGIDSILEPPPDQTQPRPDHSFDALMSSLLLLTTGPQHQVMQLLAPTNKVGCIVMLYFMSVRFIVSPLSAPPAAMQHPIAAMVEWCEKQLDELQQDDEEDSEGELKKYLAWPAKIFATLRQLLNRKGVLTFGDACEILMKDPEAYLTGRAPIL
ncbi:hypothetical protein BU24DRAFT_448951 [Aaosphaeria arxii CBS 175.79]|uniref:Zn(2)-C6 fungal-type domain-containing protein n=1 Tax=Aaosphaeria arxii CBS 175.79 TaxID=1450172 RepID=A0A6A5XW76_9PLEO|nr:uncharacterized protein BU24DRAFT_448951 [Aaosphaeria arxii CBS 175.79]KAF2017229.1 hypothetical protein BU24DRAFT_448951 [Aaosphaeria arxii CBS 175.79]